MRNATKIKPIIATERESEIPSTPGSPEVLSGKGTSYFLMPTELPANQPVGVVPPVLTWPEYTVRKAFPTCPNR